MVDIVALQEFVGEESGWVSLKFTSSGPIYAWPRLISSHSHQLQQAARQPKNEPLMSFRICFIFFISPLFSLSTITTTIDTASSNVLLTVVLSNETRPSLIPQESASQHLSSWCKGEMKCLPDHRHRLHRSSSPISKYHNPDYIIHKCPSREEFNADLVQLSPSHERPFVLLAISLQRISNSVKPWYGYSGPGPFEMASPSIISWT